MKRILLISDVKGWGGWVRAQNIKKYLKDEFSFDLMDAEEFNAWETRTSKEFFSIKDVKSYAPESPDKEAYNFEAFKKYTVRKRPSRNYDLYYFLFHTMLLKKSVKRLLNTDARVMTIVTGFPTLKNIFYSKGGNQERAKQHFLNLANKCVAVCANNLKSLNDLRKIYDSKKTFYMPRGVDPDIFYPMTTEFKRKDDEWKFTIAYVGKPVPEKGLIEFIKPACEQAGVRIIVNDRNYENALSPGEMNKFYNRADAYVVASTIDGTPNPALEAAACGKPIISNEIGNMPDFIEDGQNGFLIKEMKVEKYAQKLRWMKVNQKRSFEMGLNARRAIEKDWTWREVLHRHERKVFRQLA